MRQFFTALLFLLYTTCAIAQTPKGFSVAKTDSLTLKGKTYALIIGISKYQNPGIPQLQFADKDAIVFDKYLIESGVDTNNIILLLNENAKDGDIRMAIGYLIDSAKAGDKVFFYFSGHGDVESKSLMHDAYLLPYDSPKFMYGSILIYQLEGYLATISAHGAQVIFVCDACHSGKLAGGRDGMDAAAAALGNKWKDQIKILSCSPGEISLEGSQWGNGRGLFSYELINGMSGVADRNGDGKISLKELNLFLMEKVPDEAGTIPQNPIVLGNMETEMAKVNTHLLSAFSAAHIFSAIDTKGIEESILSTSSDSIKKYYELFKSSMEGGALAAHDIIKVGAFQYLNKIPVTDSTKMMVGIMKRNLAAKMINDINYYTDCSLNNGGYDNYGFAIYYAYPYEEELYSLVGKEKLKELGLIPKMMFMKLLYDDDVFIQPSPASLKMLDSIITMDPKAAYALSLYSFLLSEKKEFNHARDCASKVIDLTPSFAFPYRLLSEIYLKKNNIDSSLFFARKLIQIDSSFLSSASFLLALDYFFLGKNDSSYYYFNQYKYNLRNVKDCWNCELVGLYSAKVKLEKPQTDNRVLANHSNSLGSYKTVDGNSKNNTNPGGDPQNKSVNTDLLSNDWEINDDSIYLQLYRKYNLINLEEKTREIKEKHSSSPYQYYSYTLLRFLTSNNAVLEDRAGKLEQSENEFIDKMYFAPATIKFSAENYFRLACYYSSTNNQRFGIDCLTLALDNGFNDVSQLKNNKNIDNIRNNEGFRSLVAEFFTDYYSAK